MATQAEDKNTSNEPTVPNKGTEVDGTDSETPAKKQKLGETENASSGKKTGGSRKKKSDADMMAEAKAFYGELDTSAGRSLRRRSEAKPVEEKKKATPRRNSKKKEPEKSPEKEEKEKQPEENSVRVEEEQKQEEKKTEESGDASQVTEKKTDDNNEKSDDKEKHKEETKTE